MKKLFILTTLIGHFALATTATLDGNYTMKLKTGDNIFEDKFSIRAEKPDSAITVLSYNGPVVGELNVPGMFNSSLVGHTYCDRRQSICKLNFEIVASENGQSYKVFYQGEVKNRDYRLILRGKVKPHFSGEATLEDGSLLGTFDAEQDSE